MALQEEFEKHGNWLFSYRSYLPLILFVPGIYLFIHKELNPDQFIWEGTNNERYYFLFCLLVSLVGLIIRMFTVGYSSKNTSGRNVAGQVADSINTNGIYSIVRHPLYLGNFFMWLGPALLNGNVWFITIFCLVYWLYYERIMFSEEQYLRRKFGEAYLVWSSKVPAFIPALHGYVSPESRFNWNKVLRNEKNGLIAILIIFCFFDILGEYYHHSNNYNYVLLISTALALFFYLIYKIQKTIKRKSKELMNPST